jgi:flagellar hook-associated protein 1 FlgK
MSLDAALISATSGLRHVSRGLANASENVAKADVDGYTRKQVSAEALVNGGVRSLEPTRDVDLVLRAEAMSARSQASAAAVRDAALAVISRLHGSPEDGTSIGGLISALGDQFTQLQGVPSDVGRQQAALGAAADIVQRFNSIGEGITDARQAAQDGIVTDVAAANTLLQQIARADIAVRNEIAAGRSGAEFADQRDTAIAKLSGIMELTPAYGSDGGVSLLLPGGKMLPLDPEGSPLSVANATVGPEAYYGPGGSLPGVMLNGSDITASLRGGSLGERIALRDGTLPRMQAELDLAAGVLAERLSEQGLTLFVAADGTSVPDTTAYTGTVVGFAQTMRVNPDVLREPRLLRDGTHDVTATAGGATAFTRNPVGGPASFTTLLDRITRFSFGEEVAAGVAHGAIPTAGLGPDQRLSSAFQPPARIADYASAVVGAQASDAAAASARAAETASLQGHLDTMVQQREGVDVDTEMAAMIQLQNAYAANARVLSAVQGMWDALLSAVR